MRSRYCAYALGLVEYLIKSTHPEGPHWRQDRGAWRRELHQWCKQTRFEGLQVLEVEQGPLAQEGFVTFHARLSQDQRDLSFSERSRFTHHEGRWKYLDGRAPA
jgi:SEC-C motif-containing protein